MDIYTLRYALSSWPLVRGAKIVPVKFDKDSLNSFLYWDGSEWYGRREIDTHADECCPKDWYMDDWWPRGGWLVTVRRETDTQTTGDREAGDWYAGDWLMRGGRLIRGTLVTERRKINTRMTGDREAEDWYADDCWPRGERLIRGWLVTEMWETDTRMTGDR